MNGFVSTSILVTLVTAGVAAVRRSRRPLTGIRPVRYQPRHRRIG